MDQESTLLSTRLRGPVKKYFRMWSAAVVIGALRVKTVLFWTMVETALILSVHVTGALLRHDCVH